MSLRRRKTRHPFDVARATAAQSLSGRGGGPLVAVAAFGALIWLVSQIDGRTLVIFSAIGCAVAAVVAVMWWNERTARARAKLALITRQEGLVSIAALTWQEFEELVGELYRRRGFDVRPRAQDGADGGIDIVLEREGKRTLVQCKHWKSTTVGAPIVREMMGLIIHQQAVSGKIVCSGKFTRQAVEFAQGKPIELINGDALWALVEETKRNISALPER